jgi:hypothetical protein
VDGDGEVCAADTDSDDDGIDDGEEVAAAGWYYGEGACPNPKNSDSDGDGLLDGDETITDPCDPDTDGDGVHDEDEVHSQNRPDPRDQSNPRVTAFPRTFSANGMQRPSR